jgi:hypothetical protein
MRTTLDVDADILRAAKVLADAERKSLGEMLSELVRKGLAEAATASGLAGEDDSCRGMQAGEAAVKADRNVTTRRRG